MRPSDYLNRKLPFRNRSGYHEGLEHKGHGAGSPHIDIKAVLFYIPGMEFNLLGPYQKAACFGVTELGCRLYAFQVLGLQAWDRPALPYVDNPDRLPGNA